jgi:hypothetical protein
MTVEKTTSNNAIMMKAFVIRLLASFSTQIASIHHVLLENASK